MTKMTTEEAFVKVLQKHGIAHAFGIIGSAMMPISDLFPSAGIQFWDAAHEGNAGMMADGYTRARLWRYWAWFQGPSKGEENSRGWGEIVFRKEDTEERKIKSSSG